VIASGHHLLLDAAPIFVATVLFATAIVVQSQECDAAHIIPLTKGDEAIYLVLMFD